MRHHAEVFEELGFVVLRNILQPWECNTLRQQVLNSLDPVVGSVEYEVDVAYPGAPKFRTSPGSSTPRRLLHALGRGGFFSLVFNPKVTSTLRELLNRSDIAVSQSHHNCIMTKFPRFSSDTDWHRDFRFWEFDSPNMISAWFALQEETADNGSLSLIPGSHAMKLGNDRFDDQSFFKSDYRKNNLLIESAVNTRLRPGDVLLFHSQLLHSARRNHSAEIKISPVFTYHSMANQPAPNTKSSMFPSIQESRLLQDLR